MVTIKVTIKVTFKVTIKVTIKVAIKVTIKVTTTMTIMMMNAMMMMMSRVCSLAQYVSSDSGQCYIYLCISLVPIKPLLFFHSVFQLGAKIRNFNGSLTAC